MGLQLWRLGRTRSNNKGGVQPPLVDAWHSFDRTPWKHPWLTGPNLKGMRDFTKSVLKDVEDFCIRIQERGRKRFWARRVKVRSAFVGNMANNLYLRAAPLRKFGLDIDVLISPFDRNFICHPGWEEFDGEVLRKSGTIDDLARDGVVLPEVHGVFLDQPQPLNASDRFKFGHKNVVAINEVVANRSWLAPFGPMLCKIREYNSVLATQCPYLAKHSGRDYLVAQSSGEIWFEASRGDWLGREQREAFSGAKSFLVSNPWSYSHARRYGLKNLIHVPLIIDDEKYSPGMPKYRAEWKQKIGGEFFVLSTARLDEEFKGSSMALNAFKEFAKVVPEARLVVLGWGSDLEKLHSSFLGDPSKVLFLPMAGKVRLIDYLRSADCLLDQFVVGYYGATAIEAMLTGLPVIMRIEAQQYEATNIGGAPPVLNCGTSEEIFAALSVLYSNNIQKKLVADKSREWALENHGASKWKDVYNNLLFAIATGFNWDYSGSPLNFPLSAQEIEYHKQELSNAPAFPNYT